MEKTELKIHLTTLQEGYKNQIVQLKQGLEQMLMQKEQIDTNIPLLETEIEAVSSSLERLGAYLGTDEEE